MDILKNNNELTRVCHELLKVHHVGIDTEFTRRKTYFAKLSLIQIYSGTVKSIIDAQSPNLNLEIFNELILSNPKIVKIIHSGRQDFEIFYQLFKTVPKNVFDTQIAAKVCGLGAYLSYSKLCELICDLQIDKTHQKADWSIRPIELEMLKYAIDDVRYLERIYNYLHSKLIENNFEQQFLSLTNKDLLDIKIYQINPAQSWQKVRLPGMASSLLNKIKIIAAYREECAVIEDLPRSYVATDQDLLMICQKLPKTLIELKKLNLKNKIFFKTKYQDKLINLCLGIREVAAYDN